MRLVAVGRFDGVHLGHRHLLSEARRLAQERNLRLTAYTFPPRGPALLPLPAKRRLLADLCDEVIVRPWEEIQELSAEEFVREELVGRLGARGVVLGPDHRFGRGAAGDVELLRSLGQRLGFTVHVVEPLLALGDVISSRRIRRLVEEGEVEQAARLLGRPHALFGDRERGAGLAKELGFPTVNLRPWPGLVKPRAGVYVAWAHWRGGGGGGLFYIGERPTFPELPPSAELHLLSPPTPEPEGALEVALLKYVRGDMRFADHRDLMAQIERDRATAEVVLRNSSPPSSILVTSPRGR